MSHNGTAGVTGRIDEEGDWIVRQFVAPEELRLEPEVYVARHAHNIGAFAFHPYRFADPLLGAWVRRVAELLASEEEVERCREQHLTREEADAARRQAVDDL